MYVCVCVCLYIYIYIYIYIYMGEAKRPKAKGKKRGTMHIYIWHPKTLISNPGDFSICQSIDLYICV